MKKTIFVAALLITVMLSSGVAFAWPGGHGKGGCDNQRGQKGQGMTAEIHAQKMENRLEKMAVILDLTEPQKGQIAALMNKQFQDRQTLRAEIQGSKESFCQSRQESEFNESEFRAKAQKHADLKTEMMVQQAKNKQQILAILTPEQQQKAEQLKGLCGERSCGKRGGERDCRQQGSKRGKGFGQRGNK